jgi:hypothetical protein
MEDSADQLYLDIGNSTYQKVFGARRPTDDELKEQGQNWLATNKASICGIIRDPRVQRVIKSKSSGEEAVRTLVDIVGAFSIGIPPNMLGRVDG